MAFGVFFQQSLGALVLLGYDARHLFVDKACALVAVGLRETVFLPRRVVVADVRQAVAHAVVDDHGVGLLGDAFKVVGGACGDAAEEQLFGGAASEGGAHLVEKSLFWCYLALFGQIPGCAESFSARNYGDLYQWVGIAQEPADCGVARFMDGDSLFLFVGGYLRTLLETAHDSVDGVDEVLSSDGMLVVARGDQGCLVADVGYVGSRETGRLACKEVYVDAVVGLDVAQMNLEDRHTVVEVG